MNEQSSLQLIEKQHSENEIQNFIDVNMDPLYVKVHDCLENMVVFSNANIYSLAEYSIQTVVIARIIVFSLTAMVIVPALYSDKDFLTRIPHEFRMPMNGTIGITAIEGSHLDGRRRIMADLSKIPFPSCHLLLMIHDVLDMSKIEQTRQADSNVFLTRLSFESTLNHALLSVCESKPFFREKTEVIQQLSIKKLYLLVEINGLNQETWGLFGPSIWRGS